MYYIDNSILWRYIYCTKRDHYIDKHVRTICGLFGHKFGYFENNIKSVNDTLHVYS